MKAHFSNLKIISYHPAGNRVHTNFNNDLQESLEKDTEIDDDDDLSQMLSQRSTLLTRTVRHLGGPDWANDPDNETEAQFVDSDGEEMAFIKNTNLKTMMKIINQKRKNESAPNTTFS